MSETCTIARAAPEHLSEIPKIEQAAVSVFTTADLPVHLRYRVTDGDALRLAQQDGRLWVALEDDGRAVGFALADVADGQAYLEEIDVHPDHARQGIGSRLLQCVVRWAVAQEFERVLLVTFRHLLWNAPFYEKAGFLELAAHEIGPELRQFIEEEREAGINIDNRIAMALDLRPKPEAY